MHGTRWKTIYTRNPSKAAGRGGDYYEHPEAIIRDNLKGGAAHTHTHSHTWSIQIIIPRTWMIL